MARSTAETAARDQRKATKGALRAQRRLELRCFWTKPFGHEYVDGFCFCIECGQRLRPANGAAMAPPPPPSRLIQYEDG